MLHFLLFSNSGYAQKISNAKTLKMKQLISQLDTTKFKNNILYDIVYPLADLKHFNQQNRKDTSNFAHFSQTIFELKLASRNSFKISNEVLDGIKFAYEKQNKCPIAILNLDFTTIKDNAFDENEPKMQIDSTNNIKRLIELLNKNPYENKHTIVISPLVEKLVNDSQPINFVFNKLFFDISENSLKNLNITFDNNETINIINNGNLTNPEVSHQFSGDGKKLLKFTGSFQNGQQFETYATFQLTSVNQNRNTQYYDKSLVKQIRADEIFQPYESEPDAPYTHTINRDDRAAMNFQVFYGKNKHKLTKPIIIIDVIDYTYEHRYNYPWYNPDIEEIKWRFSRPENNYFGRKLRDSLYDIVIGDFPDYSIGDLVYISNFNFITGGQLDTIPGGKIRKGGADYIQRNAKVLKKLIQAVNDSLAVNNSNEQSILIGPSMGGLVSRWALKEMEDEEINHNVKLWVSFDTPHQGANVPIGFQALAEHIGMYGDDLNNLNGTPNINSSLNQFGGMDALSRVASKQMLVKHIFNEHHISGYPFIEIVSGGAPHYRNRFKNELNNLGYPQNLRKIAVINGSFFGETYGNGSDEFLHTHFWMDSAPWGDVVDGHIKYDANNGLSFAFNFDYGNAITALTSIQDAYKATLSDSQFGSFDAGSGSFGYDIPDFSNDYDNISFTLFRFVTVGSFPTINLNIYIDGYIHQFKHKFNFMPTKSSLDFKGSNKKLNESLCHYGNLSTQNLTPFDCYYAPLHNEAHIELNQNNMDWLFQEILGNYHNEPFPDSSLCSAPLSLTGPRHLCPGDQETYQVNTTQNVTWTLDGLTEISRTNNSITVTKNSMIGLATLTATVNNSSVSKNIFCKPIIDPIHHGDNTIQLRTGNENLPLDQQGITNVTWELTHGTGNIDYADDRTADINSNDYYGIVTVTNESGSVSKPFFGPNPDKCYIIKKVATDKYQVIDRCNGYTALSTMPIKEIYDQYGTKITDAPVINDKIDISNTGNSGDIRIIRVVVNGENVSKTIIKD